MRKPSVLFLNRVYPPVRGATGRVLRDLAQAFVRDGWDVTVVTSGVKPSVSIEGGIHVISVKGAEKPGLFGYMFVWIKMFLRSAFLPRADLVVSMTDPPMLVVAGDLLCRIKKSKHIHWCQDVYPDLFPALGVSFPKFMLGAMRRGASAAMGRADKVIVIGRCMARYLGYAGVSVKTMALIPNWPDMELGSASATGRVKNDFDKPPLHTLAKDAAKKVLNKGAVKRYREPEDQARLGPKFRVLYAGNIGLAHPIDTVLDAAEILCAEYPEIEFVFVGDGPRYDRIAEERGKRHLDNIRLLPFQPVNRLRAMMESGDVHLISMKDDAAGMIVPSKLYAALAVGRPCVFVGPRESEVGDVLSDFKAGDVIAQGDAQGLAACIREYRLDGDKWFAAKEGAERAGKTFVPKAAIAAWVKRARGVLERGQEAAAAQQQARVDEDVAA